MAFIERVPIPGRPKIELGDHGAAQQAADLEAGDGQDRDERITQRMFQDNDLLVDALGASGTDVVAVEHFKHSRPDQARQKSRRPGAQGEDRQHHASNIGTAHDRQDAQSDREDEDQHQPQPEGGHRRARNGDQAHDVV